MVEQRDSSQPDRQEQTWFDDPAGALREVADAADRLLRSMGEPAGDGSPMHLEREAMTGRFGDDDHGDLGQRMVDAGAYYCGQYLALVSRSVREVASSVDRHVFALLPPVVRSHIEFAARANWLVEAIDGDVAEAGFARVCRMNLDLYVSKCYQRTALKAMSSPEAKAAQGDRAASAECLARLFTSPSPNLNWTGVGSEAQFQLGGHGYPGLTAVTTGFLARWKDGWGAPAEGLYDALSGFAHPSPSFLGELFDFVDTEDGRTIIWDVDPGFIVRMSSYSCIATQELTGSLARYVGRLSESAPTA